MKHRTPKVLLLILAMLILALCLPGCESPQEEPSEAPSTAQEGDTAQLPQVHICVDDVSPMTSSSLSKLLLNMPGNGKDFQTLTETVPASGAERETTLTRIRTELMAGAGPDLFICSGQISKEDGTPLFPFPRQAMKNRLFLPLDGYIAKAQYMEWDHLLPSVMEAGANEEGQQLLPLLYRLPIILLPAEAYPVQQPLPKTYQEMLDSSDPAIQFVTGDFGMYSDIFGELIDYGKEEPTFTEEELVEVTKAHIDFTSRRQAGEFPDYSFFWEEGGMYATNEDILYTNWFGATTNSVDQPIDAVNYTLVPICNQEGGVTATITEFMAVNRNTEVPGQAFLVADYLMSDKVQKKSFVLDCRSDGITPNMELGHKADGSNDDSTWQNAHVR